MTTCPCGTALPLLLLPGAGLLPACTLAPPPMERVLVAPDGAGFRLDPSGREFRPWGFNYDHDRRNRLLEDSWESEEAAVAEDFQEMRALGANLVRIHLQVGRFLEAPDRSRAAALERLSRLVDLAERTGLYLDLTGLGCYRRRDLPAWYDALDEQGRWAAGAWLGPPFGRGEDAFTFVQFITLDSAGRQRPEIARAWTRYLVRAIREVDPDTLVTIGLVPWSLDRPGLTSGFVPEAVAPELDFLAVHLYPDAEGAGPALDTLRGFAAAGRPVLVEETFPLHCGIPVLAEVMDRSQGLVAGWVSFYWGATPAELAASGELRDAILRQWLLFFRDRGRAWQRGGTTGTETGPGDRTPPAPRRLTSLRGHGRLGPRCTISHRIRFRFSAPTWTTQPGRCTWSLAPRTTYPGAWPGR